ncbi:MAG: hypothetical protein RLZZ265_464, partial [Verrucomicrobiota bacterium]
MATPAPYVKRTLVLLPILLLAL